MDKARTHQQAAAEGHSLAQTSIINWLTLTWSGPWQDKYEKAVDKARTQQQAAAEAAAQRLQKTTEEAAHKLEAATTEAAHKLQEVQQQAQRASEAAQRNLQDTQARPFVLTRRPQGQPERFWGAAGLS